MNITDKQLMKLSTYLKARPGKAEEVAKHLNAAMKEAQINTRLRVAAFLAQLLHESGGFRYMEELADGKAYDITVNPKLAKRLGNDQPGDGPKYKGRGPIQITGKFNYKSAGEALGIDLVKNPELAATHEVGFRLAAWYWNTRKLNALADAEDFIGITRAVNGGTNGIQDRTKYYNLLLEILSE